MFKTLRNILRSRDPDEEVASDLDQMWSLAAALVHEAGDVFWGAQSTDDSRKAFYSRDRAVNALQQNARKHMVSQLARVTPMQQARLLVLMGVLKDVERLGDYAKNLLEAAAMLERPLHDDELTRELRSIRDAVELALSEARAALNASDPQQARDLIARGHAVARRCDALLVAVVGSSLSASTAVPLALAARYYKRLQKHLMNVLSTVTMPLHKIDYFE